jgi:hypothetical protein
VGGGTRRHREFRVAKAHWLGGWGLAWRGGEAKLEVIQSSDCFYASLTLLYLWASAYLTVVATSAHGNYPFPHQSPPCTSAEASKARFLHLLLFTVLLPGKYSLPRLLCIVLTHSQKKTPRRGSDANTIEGTKVDESNMAHHHALGLEPRTLASTTVVACS